MFLGMKYEECGKKRSCKRYNHRKGFQRKMIECKRVTHDNIFIEFQRVNENNTNIIHRYATDPKMFSCQAMNSSVASSTHSINATPVLHEQDTSVGDSAPQSSSQNIATPSGKRKRVENENLDKNSCRKCFTLHGSRTDNEYNSLWINCARRKCNYWIHAYCLGLVVEEAAEDRFADSFQYFCPSHNPKRLPKPRSIIQKNKNY